tara:strand:- start:734 stop:1162 length:429 start_codon:yes stop_codon:yes gene_type:complete
MKINESKVKQIINEEMMMLDDKHHMDHVDEEGGMAKSQLYNLAKYAIMLHDALEDETQLESWVQSKITIATEYMGKVKHYLEYEMGLQMEDPDMDIDYPEEDSPCGEEIEPQGQPDEPMMSMDDEGNISYEITEELTDLMEN